MKYHGNYCGPGWSAGEYQNSVVSDVPAVDEFDDTCRDHDAAYATHGDLLHADLLFAHRNFGKGFKRSAAAVAVGGQAAIRAIDKYIPNIYQTKEKTSNKRMSFRGSKIQVARNGTVPAVNGRKKSLAPDLKQVSAPAIFGTVLRGSTATSVKKDKDSISMEVQVCIGRPQAAVQSTVPEMIGLQYLSPVCMGNDEVQNMTRVYQHFRITRAALHFRAFQGTSQGGEVIVVADSDPNYRPINTGVQTTFYQRALSTKHSLLTPLWMSESMDLPVDSAWKVCDNSNSTTIEEFQSGVVYIYTDGSTSIPGFFIINVSIEFSGLRFNSRNLISGSYQGLGTRQTLSNSAPVLNADVTLVGTGFTIGDIYALQVSSTSATFGTGNASTAWQISSGTGNIPYVIGGSNIVYARASSATQITLFVTYDSAVGGDTSDKLTYALAGAVGSTFPVCVLTQLRNSTQPTL